MSRRFVLFTVVAVVVSNLAARVRVQADTAQRHGRAPPRSSTPSAASSPASRRSTTCSGRPPTRSPLMLKVRVVLLLPRGRRARRARRLSARGRARRGRSRRGEWAWSNDRAAGRGADTLPGAKRLFLPMRTGRGADRRRRPRRATGPGPLLTPDERRLLDALVDQARARHRARPPGRGRRPGQARGRDRPAALGAADLDLARSEDAARLRSSARPRTLRDLGDGLDEATEARAARHRRSTRPSG